MIASNAYAIDYTHVINNTQNIVIVSLIVGQRTDNVQNSQFPPVRQAR